jgi:hypothetical protein
MGAEERRAVLELAAVVAFLIWVVSLVAGRRPLFSSAFLEKQDPITNGRESQVQVYKLFRPS